MHSFTDISLPNYKAYLDWLAEQRQAYVYQLETISKRVNTIDTLSPESNILKVLRLKKQIAEIDKDFKDLKQ
jgi:hypothetical protein